MRWNPAGLHRALRKLKRYSYLHTSLVCCFSTVRRLDWPTRCTFMSISAALLAEAEGVDKPTGSTITALSMDRLPSTALSDHIIRADRLPPLWCYVYSCCGCGNCSAIKQLGSSDSPPERASSNPIFRCSSSRVAWYGLRSCGRLCAVLARRH